ncbi:MAG: hypothetical protein QNJ12_18680 [Ilumatobacter sp.]|uniref:hypothetical protein n=1 Tax=Ilumatobacter sp. TaxID=1967498 RepID=UPI00260566DC|nr:hypothetical protein [Ilumatobacter sp.]MDJ0770826.1 hypothetical protein [Ilumatobacter sp.]
MSPVLPPTVMTVLLIVANLLGATMALPQAVRLIRTGRCEGLSGPWAGLSLAMNLWWLSYGLAERVWGLVPVSAVGAAVYALIVVTWIRLRGWGELRAVSLGAAVGLFPLPFLLVGGWFLAGLAIGAGYGVQLAPAVLATFRTRDLRGVAAGMWLMAWVEAAIFLLYGITIVDGTLLIGGASGVALSTAVLARLAVTGHRPFRVARPAWALG